MIWLCFIICQLIDLSSSNGINQEAKLQSNSQINQYQTKYFSAYVDNFSYRNDSATFSLKYLISTKRWKRGNAILFHCGNQNNIELISESCGFVWELGEELSAMVVFAEHRYYGSSLPFGNSSFKNSQYFGYLSSEQALADYANLLTHLKATIDGAHSSAVIAFGGSYGGLLSTWFRQKYPNIVAGSLASSAPMLMETDFQNCYQVFKVLTEAFRRKGGRACVENIHRIWPIIEKMNDKTGLNMLSKIFHFCNPLKDANQLREYISKVLLAFGVLNYPYPVNHGHLFPAWPVTVFCQPLSNHIENKMELLTAFSVAMQTYGNHSGHVKCFSLNYTNTPTLSKIAWDIQTCTEHPFPLCYNGKTDMFYEKSITKEKYDQDCLKSFGVKPRLNWNKMMFGNNNFREFSNIIFSNGMLDPWAAGGIFQSSNKKIEIIKILNGAHNVDLRSSHPLDTLDIRQARNLEKKIIKRWIEEWVHQ